MSRDTTALVIRYDDLNCEVRHGRKVFLLRVDEGCS